MTPPRFTLIDGSAGLRLLLSSFIRSRHVGALIDEIDPFSQTIQGFSASLSARPVATMSRENHVIIIGSIGTLAEARAALAKLFQKSSQHDCAPVTLLVPPELIAAREALLACGAFAVLRKDTLSFSHFFQVVESAFLGDRVASITPTNDDRQYGQFAFVSRDIRHVLDIDGYRPLAQFSNGQRAKVFFAEHINSGKRAVIKVQTAASILDLGSLKETCGRAIAISKHHTSHLVRAIDAGISSGYPYVVLEYLSAGDLRRKMQAKLDIPAQISIVIGILTALAELHHVGYVHADLKPESIFFRADGSVVLIDFNISVRFGCTVGASLTGDVLGTPTYMSPEQGAGKIVDATSDLYSIGIVLYELLTGTPPFTADTPAQIIYRHLHDEVPLLPARTRSFQVILDHLLAKDANERPQTAIMARNELVLALDNFVRIDNLTSTHTP